MKHFYFDISKLEKEINKAGSSVAAVIKNFLFPPENIWDKVKNLPGNKFSDEINKNFISSSRPNPKNVIKDPNDFFVKPPETLTCDDFTEMWWWWAKENGHTPYHLTIYSDPNMHHLSYVCCVIQLRNQKFVLCDYIYGYEVDCYSKCIEKLSRKYDYKKELIIANY